MLEANSVPLKVQYVRTDYMLISQATLKQTDGSISPE